MFVRVSLSAIPLLFVSHSDALAQFLEPDTQVIELFEGSQNGDYFGWVAANVGDLDGDGASELLIPAIGFNGFAGRVTLYSGATGAIVNDIFGVAGAALGYALGGAGDVDGDGTGDYIIGGGQTLVYSGASHQPLHDLSSLVGFAHSVAGAGDLNGDGYGDVLVGFQGSSITHPNEGRLFAVSGSSGTVLWTREGEGANHALGSAAGGLGDLNGDGVPDVVVGAFGAGPSAGGEAYVLSGTDGELIFRLKPFDETTASVFGQFFASSAGDVDDDGLDDIFVGDYNAEAGTGRAYVFSGRDGFPLHLLAGFQPGDGFGPGRGIPDANGDGHADVLVAAYTNGSGAAAAGATYLFSGRSGALLRTITSTVAGDNFGVDALAAGDIDGDGLPDILVTAVGLSFAGVAPGSAYLISGTVLPCPADLTANGRVNGFDLLLLVAAIRYPELQLELASDLNGDGATDLEDLAVMLRDWGQCPAGKPQ